MDARCIFCKKDASSSKSLEHIIPESLGNEEHTLPPGVVCDACNNYFASSIEQPVLESGYFVTSRFNALIPNKRQRMPLLSGILLPGHLKEQEVQFHRAEVSRNASGNFELYPEAGAEEAIASGKVNRVVIPASGAKPKPQLFSRFLAKAAVECMAYRLLDSKGDLLREVTADGQLDLLRNYARYGKSGLDWPYSERRIYGSDFLFPDGEGNAYEVLHEWIFLYTDSREMYFVIAILGVEYAINVGGPDIDGFGLWLRQNGGRSPLY
jgi:HNH endonuclease